MGLSVYNNVEAQNAHRLLANTGNALNSRWSVCRPVCGSTAPPMTPPVSPSLRACAPRSAA